jgi:TetR/AcrR family transcriptional regulator, ethionamide resistance regulator
MSTDRSARALQASRATDRPRSHAGTSDTELAIFAATERLLAKVPLHDISVAQIIEEAGVARATFYFYFSSKYAVVAGLLAQVMDEIYEVVEPFRARTADEAPDAALRRSLEAATVVWGSHRAAVRATVEHWHAIPELHALWLGVVQRFTEAVATEIDRQRREGLAPPGVDSRQLAAGLIWSTERILYIGGLGVDDNLPTEKDTVDLLMALWLGVLYGAQAPAAAGGGTARKPATTRKRA